MNWNSERDYWRSEYERLHGASVQPPEPREAERRHLWNRQTVSTLATLALVSGLFVGAALGTVALLASWARVWAWFLAGAVLGSAGAWGVVFGRWMLLTAPIEQWTGIDINGDGYIGEPDPKPETIIRLIDDTPDAEVKGQHVKAILPVSEEELVNLAVGLRAGRPFCETEWSGRGRPFSGRVWRALVKELEKRKLIEPAGKGRSQGFTFTPGGRAMLRHYCAMSSIPPSLSGERSENV